MKNKRIVKFPKDSLFADYLRSAYSEKKMKNHRLSIRGFSLMLGIDQSLLHKVLKEDRRISEKSRLKCLKALNADEETIKRLESNLPSKVRVKILSDEEFEALAHWKYFAVLELLRFRPHIDVAEIARKFSLPPEDVQNILAHLTAQGFLSCSDGVYQIAYSKMLWPDQSKLMPSSKHFQEALLRKGIDSLDSSSYEFSAHGTVVLALDKSKLSTFKEIMESTRKQLLELIHESQDFDEVFALQLSLFPLTNVEI